MKPKRSRGGYVMIYVMVVIAIISAMSLSVSSISLRNLQAQEASIRQMKDTYAAEGMVEMFCVWLKEFYVQFGYNDFSETSLKDAWDISKGELENSRNGTVEISNFSVSGNSYTVTITAKSNNGAMQVVAVLEVTTGTSSNGFTTVKEVKYTSYTVSPAEKTEGGGSGGGSE